MRTWPAKPAATVRERLEAHRANPCCNACHGVMDPLGFALENFDAVGRWRERDREAGSADRRVRRAAGRHAARRPDDAAQRAAREARAVRADVDREADDVCARPDGRVPRHADRARHRARRRGARTTVLVDRAGHRRTASQFQMQARRCRRATRSRRVAPSSAMRADRWPTWLNTMPRTHRGGSTCSSPRKHLSRRTFLRGLGASHGAAVAGRDDSGGHGAGANRRRSEAAHRLHLLPARRGHGRMDADRDGARLRAAADPGAARAVQGADDGRQQPAQQGRARARRAHGQSGHVARLHDRRQAARRRAEQRASRPTRSPRSTSVRTRRSRRSSLRRERRRAAAAATRSSAAASARPSRSAARRSRCRWSTTRARCSIACSARAIPRTSARRSSRRPSSLLDLVTRERRVAARQARRRRTVRWSSEYLDSVREIERRVQKHGGPRHLRHRPAGRAGRRAGRVRQAARDDVRYDRARVSGGSDARGHVHDGGGSQHAARTTRSACRMRSIRCRTTRTIPTKLERLANVQTYHTKMFARLPREAWRTRRTVTARCSIIPSCCTAAT